MAYYRPRGALARTLYEKVHNDQYLEGYDMKLVIYYFFFFVLFSLVNLNNFSDLIYLVVYITETIS